MKPSEIRRRVLADHAELRMRLAELSSIASHILAGRTGVKAPLRKKVNGLCNALLRHLVMEENFLLPAIREVDAWGPIRAGRMEQEHQAQSAALEWLLCVSEQEESRELARAVNAFGRSLLKDMDVEERELLNPDLLRDDLISIDQFVG